MKILFKVYPQRSHYNATFTFARMLREQGHKITYTGLQQLKTYVEAQGYPFHTETEDVYPCCEQNQMTPFKQSLLSKCREMIQLRKWAKNKWSSFQAFDHLIRNIEFDYIMVDSPYSFFALTLFKHKKPFGILESMMSQDRAKGCPPLNSTYVPNNSWISDRICDLLWTCYLFKRWMLGIIGLRPDYNRQLINRTARKCGVDPSTICMSRYFHIGFRNVPEFILSPQNLDFPRKPKPNQVYIESTVDLNRPEVSSDYGFTSRFKEMISQRPSKPLVYCSLGTAGWRYKGAIPFLNRVIEASRDSSWNLIMAIGTLDRNQFVNIPGDVAIFESVPQIQVLKSADLMITHGGMNSISECVAVGAPMLVYPGCHRIDQAGNAARVVYNRIGLMGSIRSESQKNMIKKIRIILTNPMFYEQILRKRINCSGFHLYENTIESTTKRQSKFSIHNFNSSSDFTYVISK